MTMSRRVRNLLFCLLLYVVRQAVTELDTWKRLNREGQVHMIATNSRALYVIDAVKTLKVIDNAGESKVIDQSIAYTDVDADNGLFIVTSSTIMKSRVGISSSDAVGTSWNTMAGMAFGIATGRQGLLFHWNDAGNTYVGVGISSSTREASSWAKKSDIMKKMSCNEIVCFSITKSNELYSSGPIPTGYSPEVSAGQLTQFKISTTVADISAFSKSAVWKIDANGVAWEDVSVVGDRFINMNWKQRGYGAEKLTKITVTEKIQFAIAEDSHTRVFTGCPIFDFEENDLSGWIRTGTAFANQPVVGQETFYPGGASGKEGHRIIDSKSSRTSYDMAEDAAESSQGNAPTGTMRSPAFQIRTNMLHFIIGGGSSPENYVSLYINEVERFRSASSATGKIGPNGKVRAARYWWDVSSYINQCAYIKIVDEGTQKFGNTMFDDLCASPPCFKGFKVKLVKIGHDGNVSVGQEIRYRLHLNGFYTSKIRKLLLNVSFPVEDGAPFVYIKNITRADKCSTSVETNTTRNSLPSTSKRFYSYIYEFENYLLSDSTFEIVARVHDHDSLQNGTVKIIQGVIKINFMNEFLQTINHQLKITRHGNETAKMNCTEEIMNAKEFDVGENITYNVVLNNKGLESLQRATNVMIKIFLPPYLEMVAVNGLQMGDKQLSPSVSQTLVLVKELHLDDDRNYTFIMAIKSDYEWNRLHSRTMNGIFLADVISYCPRKSCKNALGSDPEVVFFAKGKQRLFTVRQRQKMKASQYTKIVPSDRSFLILCGMHTIPGKGTNAICYYGNSSTSAWHSLNPVIRSVLYYDGEEKTVYGSNHEGKNVAMYGAGLKDHKMLSNEEWTAVLTKKASLTASTVVKDPGKSICKEFGDQLQFQWECCSVDNQN